MTYEVSRRKTMINMSDVIIHIVMIIGKTDVFTFPSNIQSPVGRAFDKDPYIVTTAIAKIRQKILTTNPDLFCSKNLLSNGHLMTCNLENAKKPIEKQDIRLWETILAALKKQKMFLFQKYSYSKYEDP